MILKTRKQDGVTVFELEGLLDFETTLQFQNTCSQWIKNSEEKRFVFNLEKLKFVGSSGINQFIQSLKTFYVGKSDIKFCNLSSEFKTLFKAFESARISFEIFDDETEALKSFAKAPTETETEVKRPLPRKKRTEN